MKVVRNSVVTLNYHVTDPDGVMVDEGKEPLVYLHGGHEDIFPKIEEAVEGKTIGETVKVAMTAEEAFGDYDPELVQIEPRSDFPKDLEIGMELEGGPEGSDDEDYAIYRVTDIADGNVVLDGNHPLAGKALVFTCTVAAVRPATADELDEGCVMGDESDA